MRRTCRIGRHKPLLQQRKRRTAQPVSGQLDGAKRWRTEGCRHDIVKPQHRDIVRHPNSCLRQGLQTTERQIVGGAENGGGVSERLVFGQQTADGGFPHSGS